MWAVSKRMKRRLAKGQSEREALYAATTQWLLRANIGTGERRNENDKISASSLIQPPGTAIQSLQRFHGGNIPDLADVVVWGMLSAMKGMRTLADLRDTFPELDKWYTNMELLVTTHAGKEL